MAAMIFGDLRMFAPEVFSPIPVQKTVILALMLAMLP